MRHSKLAELRDGDWSYQSYRGYLLRRNALSNAMWVEKGGALICHVPAILSWEYARNQIDLLLGE